MSKRFLNGSRSRLNSIKPAAGGAGTCVGVGGTGTLITLMSAMKLLARFSVKPKSSDRYAPGGFVTAQGSKEAVPHVAHEARQTISIYKSTKLEEPIYSSL